jgi:hypothetical protein
MRLNKKTHHKMNHKCVHDVLTSRFKPHVSTTAVLANDNATTVPFEPLRIRFDLSFLDSDASACRSEGQLVRLGNDTFECLAGDVLSASKRSLLLDAVLVEARAWFEATLRVRRSASAYLAISAPNCGCGDGDVDLSRFHSARNVTETDLLVVVTARPTRNLSAGDSTVAFACACQVDDAGRANVARINWAPANLVVGRDDLRAQQVGVAIHELTHALGFSLQAFERLPGVRDAVRVVQRSAVLVDGRTEQRAVTLLTVPDVTAWAREHLGCAALDGVELEGGGSSHWEARVFGDELMTPATQYAPVRSNLTLRFLAASGWYAVAWERAEPLLFGAGQGCDFAAPRCDRMSGAYRCTWADRDRQQCLLWDGRARARCAMVRYGAPLPPWFRYDAAQPDVGGLRLADYCPLWERVNAGDCRQPLYQLDRLETRGELYGALSRCAASTLYRRDRQPPAGDAALGAACHAMACDAATGRRRIRVAYRWFDCDSDALRDDVERLTGLAGTIACPAGVACAELEPVRAWPAIDTAEIETSSGGDDDDVVVVVVRGARLANTSLVVIDVADWCNVTAANDTVVTCRWAAAPERSGFGRAYDVTVVVDAAAALTATKAAALATAAGDLVAIVTAVIAVVALLAAAAVAIWCLERKRRNNSR